MIDASLFLLYAIRNRHNISMKEGKPEAERAKRFK